MSRNIPAVRPWLVRTGAAAPDVPPRWWYVWAPTRVLARLNLRTMTLAPVISGPAPVRKDVGRCPQNLAVGFDHPPDGTERPYSYETVAQWQRRTGRDEPKRYPTVQPVNEGSAEA